MSHLLTWLTDNLRNAAAKCDAIGASVYVPTPWNDAAPGILVHVGSAPPVPEMANVTRALAFAATAAARTGEQGEPRAHDVVPSTSAEGCLIPIPMLAPHWRGSSSDTGTGADPGSLRRRLSDRHTPPPIVGWLGLRFAAPPSAVHRSAGWSALLELSSALASTYVCFYGILTDPVTGLPGRAELQATVRAELERARQHARPFALLFVRLEQLDDVIESHGRRGGDTVLREFLEVLQGTLRNSDVVMRYAEAVFALPLRDVPEAGAVIVAEKLRSRLRDRRFLDGSLQIRSAIGVVACDARETAALQPLDLLRRADQALSAARQGDCRDAVLWRPDGVAATAELLDPLLGVFTGQADKDYRNMRLLWDIVQALAHTTGTDLAEAAVSRIFTLFGATRVALLQLGADGALRLVAGRERHANSEETDLAGTQLSYDEWHANQEAFSSNTPQWVTLGATPVEDLTSSLTGVALPLSIDGRSFGTLYLLSRSERLKADQTDLPVLAGVATHLALALDRDQMAADRRRREEREQVLLRAEVERLRTAVQKTNLVFRSQSMADLLATTSRVAETDTTVLITGESGTGKEMLAHTVHDLSTRRSRPLVIVDCGAIPASLIDSELFGRERGAYTGAERRAAGRLALAHGGTLFLDEIGELPLEVQAKLLRFVQERTITMVGGTSAQRIDVRIIAATNRALETEVRAGRFREDLFHRLNVVRLRIPPLRDRRDDVLLLARHFLDRFAAQYRKGLRAFDAEAEASLLAHRWDGNIRELQNTVLQAVVLATSEQITAADLRLAAASDGRERSLPSPGRELDAQPAASALAPDANDLDAAWQQLRDELSGRLARTAGQPPMPLGRWLAHDLVLEAYQASGGVMSKAAARVGLPETTFARRLRHAQSEALNTRRPDDWCDVHRRLTAVVRIGARSGRLADDLDDVVFELIIAAVPGRIAQAAALLGVSAPTMKRRVAEYEQRSARQVCA